MSWTSVGDFNTLVATGVRTNCLASFGGLLYVGLSNGAIWRYDGVDWELSFSGFEEEVSTLLAYDSELYAGYYGSRDDGTLIVKLNNFTDEWESDFGALAHSTVQLVEHDGDLYFVTCSILWQDEERNPPNPQFQGRMYVKSTGGGTWTELTDDEENSFTVGTYQGGLYLSGRNGTNTNGTNYIQEYGGANVFTEGVGGTLVFQDLFDGATTTLSTHTPDIGGGWGMLLNDATVNGLGKLAPTTPTTPFIGVTNTGVSDGVVICDIAPGNNINNYQGVVVRAQDINNLWYCVYVDGGISPDVDDSIYIIERNGGTDTVRASAVADLQTTFSANYYFRVELAGNDISFMVMAMAASGDEHVKISYTSSFLATETLHGVVILGATASNATFESFEFITGTIDNWHCQGRRLLEFGTHFYSYDARYIHQWEGVTAWVVDHTFAFDEQSQWGFRDLIVYDSKLWAGSGTSIWVRDGGTWVEDPDSDIGYSDESVPTNMYSPPRGFAIYESSLYACGGPGEVWVRDAAPPPVTNNARGIAIARTRSADQRLWLTGWRPNTLFLRAYDIDTLEPELEVILGDATAVQVNAGLVIAYPYIPPTNVAGEVYVFGRFFYQPGVTHIMRTTNAGTDFTIIEDGWNTDVCGSMLHRGNQIYAVRNKSTLGHLYKGVDSLGFVSVMGCPVNPFAFDITHDLNTLFAGNKNPGTPRIIAASFPFVNWVDVTLNYPHAGRVKAITTLP